MATPSRYNVLPTLIIFLSAISLWLISGFNAPRYQDASVDASFFPTIVSLVMVLLSCLMLYHHIRSNGNRQTTCSDDPLVPSGALLGMLFIAYYVLLIAVVGYLLASFVAFSTYLLALKVKRLSYYIAAWSFVTIIYYLFGEVFVIALPQTMWS
ncbi:tripartite tricarboxylate transporter TctB family protein [Agarivorans sp. B2Z047]|uniref:tripartite tricarboxylate transporter TctB family protein n=1 Tax=Agarivorans sp. B2Z047 TaxID=2652721 RepID=UPI00128CCF53|nr:tripartite tricarboxylate transporter TctB family protein [Agarivorans sp. B2Z047]MPW31805.1 tripartite tricarboxylate transporter TctB family protein [Agarivorans sp. B2Z047]UQN43728.1 tripartite tricarboxylate transporter TctB family protein [Agarivorans sp. B2Z047]